MNTTAVSQGSAWTYASGLVAAREAHMLPMSFFRQLVAEPLDDVARRMSDTVLRDSVSGAQDLLRLDAAAADCYRQTLHELRRVCPSPELVALLELKDEFLRFKDFIKHHEPRLRRRTAAPARPSQAADQTWERLWKGLPTDLPPYFSEAAREARRALTESPEHPEALDVAVDDAILSALCAKAEGFGDPFVAGYFRRYETIRAVELLWRAMVLGWEADVTVPLRQGRREQPLFDLLARTDEADWPALLAQQVEGLSLDAPASGEPPRGAKRIRAFVRAADAWLMDYVRGARFVSFGPERVFGYLVGLDAELYNLKVAAIGRARGISQGALEERLRACYV